MNYKEILSIELEENDAEAKTIGEYLKALAFQIVVEEEGFSGKRPFGNSGWINDLKRPIEEKYSVGHNEANRILINAINDWSVDN